MRSTRILLYKKFDWFEKLPRPESEIDKFIGNLKTKFKGHAYDNFDDLYTYLALNNKNELFDGSNKLCFVDEKYIFIKI
jgi:hypothetical protein